MDLRTVIILAAGFLAACSSSSEDAASCPACEKEYTGCYAEGQQEAANFQITKRGDGQCTGKFQSSPVRLECTPLRLCFEASGNCLDAEYADGILKVVGSMKCD